jgi:hypothetical protein
MKKADYRSPDLAGAKSGYIRLLKSIYLILFLMISFLLAGFGNKSFAANLCSTGSGNWSDAILWGGCEPGWDDDIYIESGHVILLDISTGIKSVTVLEGGILILGDGNTLYVASNGWISNNGSIQTNTNSTVHLFENPWVGGSSSTEFFNIIIDGSNARFEGGKVTICNRLEIRKGYIAEAPFYRIGSTLAYRKDTGGDYIRGAEWNNPWHVEVSNNTYLDLNAIDFNADIVVKGDFKISAGSSVWARSDDFRAIRVQGDIDISGTLSLSNTPGGILFVGGNWNRTGGFNPHGRVVIFNGDQPQQLNGHTTFDHITIAGGAHIVLKSGIKINSSLIVSTDAILETGLHIIDGDGEFVLENKATLMTAHPEGISTLNLGTIRTKTRSFSSTAYYHYNGSENQLSGNALKNAAKIIIELTRDELIFRNNGAAITISSGGRLEIRSGTVLENSGHTGGIIDGQGDLVMKGGQYRFEKVNTSVLVPRLTGNYNDGEKGYMKGTIILAAEGSQRLRGGKNYNNLVFKGSGDKRISSKTDTIIGTVFIENDNVIVDAKGLQFGGDKTNLTMTGGRLIVDLTTSTAGPTPNMQGKYNLTGGTIDFANTNENKQEIRPATYFNIDISGINVELPKSEFSTAISKGGTLTIRAGGVLKIESDYFLAGEGNFEMQENSTLYYSHPDGITVEGSEGAIQVSGTRIFPENASYGVYGAFNQITGSGIPSKIKSFLIEKYSNRNITLSKNLEITGTIHLSSSTLITNGKELYLVNPEASALTTASNNLDFSRSFIAGALKRAVSQTGVDYVFPVGTIADKVQAVTIRFNPGLNGTETMTLIAGFEKPEKNNYYGNLPFVVDDILIDNLSGKGFWKIDSENITTAHFNLTLAANDFKTINNPSVIRILKRNDPNSPWQKAGDNFTWGGATPIFTFKQENISGFSEFAIGSTYSENPLPVEWLSFSADYKNGAVFLLWSTATETNNDFFTILSSTDGRNFTEAGRVTGAGNSNRVLTYKFIDTGPAANINYYRIRQTDFDGKESYSNIVAVQVLNDKKPLVWSQEDRIHIHAEEGNFVWHYNIISLKGIRLAWGELPAGDQRVIDASLWRQQIVLVVLNQGSEIVREKVLIK